MVYCFNEGGQLEESMRARRSRVHDPLGNTLVIEMRDFSRRMKSSRSVGPRALALSEF